MRRYLERVGRQWRVVISVPRRLHPVLGTKLKESLGTDSLQAAEAAKWPVVAKLQARIEAARGRSTLSPQELEQEALAVRQQGRHPDDDSDLMDRLDEIAGTPIGQARDGTPQYEPEREQQAIQYHRIATGQATPIGSLMEQWHSQTYRKERTRGDDLRAVRYLKEWCSSTGTPATLEAITRRVAGRFVPTLIQPASNRQEPLTHKTANKYLSSLRTYWKWLEERGVLTENVWARQSLPTAHTPDEEKERPFTDAEVSRLLAGEPRPHLADLMRIAALSGARLDAIACLQVKHCQDGLFSFKPQKRETARRKVPIHSALVSLIAARTAGKAPEDELFPEIPIPPRGVGRERSMPASKAFTRYRQSVGVSERIEGNRRSLVNFHSFRRWFITKAEQAGQPVHVIESVVGHKRTGMSLGLYSGGPGEDQLRACVEAVQLPASS